MVKLIDGKIIEDVDLTQIEDGVYAGEFGDFLVDVKLEVTVQDHQITNTKSLNNVPVQDTKHSRPLTASLEHNRPMSTLSAARPGAANQ